MAKNNNDKVTEVRNMIEKYVADREREIAEIDQHIAEAEADKATAENAVNAAIEATNLDDYNKAKDQIEDAADAIEMYSARKKQLIDKEFVTEEASDKVIDSLLAYKTERDGEFIAAITAELSTISKLVSEYDSAYKAMTNTVRDWENQIHANYRNPIVSYPVGVTPPRKPVPVSIPSKCTAAIITAEYLNRIQNAIS